MFQRVEDSFTNDLGQRHQTRTMADCKRRSRFKPCIDLHDGKVKQIIGGTLSDDDPGALKTNFVARLGF